MLPEHALIYPMLVSVYLIPGMAETNEIQSSSILYNLGISDSCRLKTKT
jgi:hypothetical protein